MNRLFAGVDLSHLEKDDYSVYLQSIPYDGTSTWGKGADKGFDAFMDAMENMEVYDIETRTEVVNKGVLVLPELNGFDSPEAMFEKVYSSTKKILRENKFLTFFGGEHSISIGIIKAFYEYFENLTVLQIDAHADLRLEYNGSQFNHACALHDASKNCNLLQVGIRSMDIAEEAYMDESKVYFAQDIYGSSNWMKQCIDQMTDNVYITFDLDALDPSIMPATGTPEPGGLQWYETVKFLKQVFQAKNVVGFDLVELAPIEGLTHPQFLAAKLYYKMLSYKFQK